LDVTDFESGKTTKFELNSFNAGKSPAQVTLEEIAFNLYRTFLEKPFYPKSKTLPSVLLIMPGVRSSEFVNLYMIPELYEKVMRGTTTAYVYSHIEYRDVRTGQAHTTHICFNYVLSRKDWFVCPVYNDAN
jgi:hypothetical protein